MGRFLLITLWVLLASTHAHAQRGCLYAGWPSKLSPRGTCLPPWESNQALSQRQLSCANGGIRCNPQLFGSNHCVGGFGTTTGDYTALCMRNANAERVAMGRITQYVRNSEFRQANKQQLGPVVDILCESNPTLAACQLNPAQSQMPAPPPAPNLNCEVDYMDQLTLNREVDRLRNDVNRVERFAQGGGGNSSSSQGREVGQANSVPSPEEDHGGQLSDESYYDNDRSQARDTSEYQARDYSSEDRPADGGAVNTLLPTVADGEQARELGYYTYGQERKRYGTERTVWRLQTAGRALAEDGIVMAVGNISLNGGGRMPPHVSHQRGVDVDLRFIGSNGRGHQCNIGSNSSCLDREKTFKMVKALIDTDPDNVRIILINDASLQQMVNEYYRRTTGRNENVARPCGTTAHNDHIHFSWKG